MVVTQYAGVAKHGQRRKIQSLVLQRSASSNLVPCTFLFYHLEISGVGQTWFLTEECYSTQPGFISVMIVTFFRSTNTFVSGG
jgi:hypothetical protein